jgi:hypothetical protein
MPRPYDLWCCAIAVLNRSGSPTCYFLRRYRDLPAIDRSGLQRDDRGRMNWTLIVGPIAFVVVFAAVWGAFPRASKTKPGESDFAALAEFRSSWKDSR